MVKSVNTNKVEMDKKAAIAVVFENSEFGKVRTLTDENGEPLFCAKDLCNVLGYKRANDAVDQLVKPLDTAKRRTWVATGLKKDGTSAMRRTLMLYVNESGFYALVLGSKLSTAVKFKNWVTADVLPQIRKTGGYIPVQQGESDEETIRHAEEILRATLKEKENLLKKQRLQIEQQKKLIGEQDTEIRRLNGVVDEQVVRIAKNGDNIIQLENQVGNLLPKALYSDNVLGNQYPGEDTDGQNSKTHDGSFSRLLKPAKCSHDMKCPWHPAGQRALGSESYLACGMNHKRLQPPNVSWGTET